MANVKPFKAIRPLSRYAARVASLPYDVMNTAEARKMAKENSNSFLHVSRAEIDLPKNTDEHSAEVYAKAAENFKNMIAHGVLAQDEEDCLYIYGQEWKGRKQIGIVACSSVDDYFNEVIKKHELTRPEKEKDRMEHMLSVHAHVGPIFLTYPHHVSIDEIISNFTLTNTPVYQFRTEDAVTHTAWVIADKALIANLVSIFKNEIPFTYIADGHHRTASAAKVGKKLADQNPSHTGKEEYNFFPSVLFPDNQLQILPYNRLVKNLNGMKSDNFMTKIEEKFFLHRRQYGTASALHEIRMYLEGSWFSLTPHDDLIDETNLINSLDISLLQNHILNPLLGIKDPRTDTRIDFVGGIRGFKELEHRVDNGEMKVAFSLYPVSVEKLISIADSGEIMPPKSTWFEPKLRDGLFSHSF